MSYTGRQVLVTGAGGFIGSHLVGRLVGEGAGVRVFLRYNSQAKKGWLDEAPQEIQDRLEVVWGDLKDPEAVRRAVKGVQVVFHLGALIAIPFSYQNPTDFFQTNVLGTLHVANACREFGVERLVHTSTSEVYGTARQAPMSEDHPQTGQSPYSASKIGADRLVESFILSFGLPAVILRPFNTYGPRQSERAVIPTIVRQVLFQPVLRLGSLHPTRDLTYVTDTVEGFCRAGRMAGLEGHTLHFGSGTETSIGELAHAIMSLAGRVVPIEQEQVRIRPASSEVDRLLCDARRFRELTGWIPRVPLAEGLKDVIEFHQSRPRPSATGHFVV
jgi:dTDP-glucose 4,6-dehydratase